MFKRILIANRGEIAVRDHPRLPRLGIESVAVFSEADRAALHVRECRLCVAVGPAPARESYLNVERKFWQRRKRLAPTRYIRAMAFSPSTPRFARAVADGGTGVYRTTAHRDRKDGRQGRGAQTDVGGGSAVRAGIAGNARDRRRSARDRDQNRLPDHAQSGSGRRWQGMRLVENGKDLASAVRVVASEALSSLRRWPLLRRKFRQSARVISRCRCFADRKGDTVHVFERECSIQRRHQKVVEESPSPFITPKMRARDGRSGGQAARAVNYVSAGRSSSWPMPTAISTSSR